MERKRGKVLKDLVGIFTGPLSQTYISSVLPKTISHRLLLYDPCCAATLNYVHGARRHLAANDAHLAARRYELPQTHPRELEEHARFRINRLISTTLMRYTRGCTHHGNERADLEPDQEDPREEIPRYVTRDCKDEGAHRLCEGGPERHLLRHWREHRRCVLFVFLYLPCKKGIKVHYMMVTVDDYTVHQFKDFSGKKPMTTTEEGLILDDEVEEKKLSITNTAERIFFNHIQQMTEDTRPIASLSMLQIIKGPVTTGGIYDGSAEEHVTIVKSNMTALAFFFFNLCLTRNDIEHNGCFYDSRKIMDTVTETLIKGKGKMKDLAQVNVRSNVGSG